MVNHGKRSDRDHAGDSLALIVNGDGKVTNRYLYGALIDEVLAEETLAYDPNNNVTSEVMWALSDHQGSVRDWAKFGTEVSVVNRVDYDPFGNVIAPNPTDAAIATMFGYTGRSTDPLTKLQDNRARAYDPTLGRFISQDPMGFDAGDANLYRYVGNHPSYATDPSGLETILVNLPGGVVKRIEVPDGNIGDIDDEIRAIYQSGNPSRANIDRLTELITVRQKIEAGLEEVRKAQAGQTSMRSATDSEIKLARQREFQELLEQYDKARANLDGKLLYETQSALTKNFSKEFGPALLERLRVASGEASLAFLSGALQEQPTVVSQYVSPFITPPGKSGLPAGPRNRDSSSFGKLDFSSEATIKRLAIEALADSYRGLSNNPRPATVATLSVRGVRSLFTGRSTSGNPIHDVVKQYYANRPAHLHDLQCAEIDVISQAL